jgi:hypothetical protein
VTHLQRNLCINLNQGWKESYSYLWTSPNGWEAMFAVRVFAHSRNVWKWHCRRIHIKGRFVEKTRRTSARFQSIYGHKFQYEWKWNWTDLRGILWQGFVVETLLHLSTNHDVEELVQILTKNYRFLTTQTPKRNRK